MMIFVHIMGGCSFGGGGGARFASAVHFRALPVASVASHSFSRTGATTGLVMMATSQCQVLQVAVIRLAASAQRCALALDASVSASAPASAIVHAVEAWGSGLGTRREDAWTH